MTPANSPVPPVDPCKVSVLETLALLAVLAVNFSSPVPDWSSTMPGVPSPPLKVRTRPVVSPLPV